MTQDRDNCIKVIGTVMELMYLRLDDVQVLVEASLSLVLTPDVDGHFQPPV